MPKIRSLASRGFLGLLKELRPADLVNRLAFTLWLKDRLVVGYISPHTLHSGTAYTRRNLNATSFWIFLATLGDCFMQETGIGIVGVTVLTPATPVSHSA